MKRLTLIIAILCTVLCASAQQDDTQMVQETQDSTQAVVQKAMKFGHLSYEQALKSTPGYAMAQQLLAERRAQYAAEQQRVEKDFNAKYEEFLEGMREYPQTILHKRQTELKELLERNIAFKAEVERQLAKDEAEFFAPVKQRLADILSQIGLDYGYAFILNTDGNATPFVSPVYGEDINQLVQDALNAVQDAVE